MQTIVFTDLHGNLPALIELRKIYPNTNSWISLGDSVNYGPWSNECVSFIDEELRCKSLLGNHEEYFLSGIYPGQSIVAKTFFEFCYERFEKNEVINRYEDSVSLGSFVCSHTLDGKYIYDDTKIAIDRNYVIGHSHQQYRKHCGDNLLVNPGSLGQDRRYINRANYAVYDHELDSFKLCSFTYNIETVISEMKNQKYPQICLDYYRNKDQLL